MEEERTRKKEINELELETKMRKKKTNPITHSIINEKNEVSFILSPIHFIDV